MCDQVLYGDTVCTTPRQVATLVGGPDGLIWFDHQGEMDWCLCVIDLPKTLDQANLRWKQDINPEIFTVER
jgi:hypothetical protein